MEWRVLVSCQRYGAWGGIDGLAVVPQVTGEDGELVGLRLETDIRGGDLVADADGSLELEAAKLGGGKAPDFERLRRVGGSRKDAVKGEEIQGAGGDRDWFGIARVRGVNLHGDGIAAGNAIEVQCDGRGKQVDLIDALRSGR